MIHTLRRVRSPCVQPARVMEKGENMTAAQDYRLARQAQDDRFDRREGAGGVDHSGTTSAEYGSYFGTDGEQDGVEERVTFRRHLEAVGRENRAAQEYAERHPIDAEPVMTWSGISAASAFYLTGKDLALLAADGDEGAITEINRRAANRVAKGKRPLRGATA